MAVYVDDYRASFRGMKMSHLLADTPAELFDMIDKLGVPRKYYQNGSSPHFDVPEPVRILAIEQGAIPINCGTEAWGITIKRIKQMYKTENSREMFLQMAEGVK